MTVNVILNGAVFVILSGAAGGVKDLKYRSGSIYQILRWRSLRQSVAGLQILRWRSE